MISRRSLSKSMPGMVIFLGSRTVPVPFSIWGTGNGQFLRCQPMGVRRIRPACSRDSSASPRRSFLTDSVSRSFARVSVVPLVSKCQYLVLEAGLFLVLNFCPDLQMGGLRVGNKLQIDGR